MSKKLLRALETSNLSDKLFIPKASGVYTPLSGILYKSQLDWLTDKSSLMIADKGRQIGFSWVDSLKSVTSAINGVSTYYTSFNKDTTENYIRYSLKWAKALNHIIKVSRNQELVNNRDTLIYKLKFTNGASISALAGNAVNLRDKGGDIVIDEAAFRQDLEQIMDAALAILIWGGTVRIFSTHFGVDSYFNKLLNEAASRQFSRHHIPFRKALSEGLFKRICIRKGVTWSQELEDKWVDDLYIKYGSGAAQELDCIPSEDTGLGLFRQFQYIPESRDTNSLFRVRSWDLAATEKGGCFSVGVLMSYSLTDGIIIESVREGQWGAIDGDSILVGTAKSDGPSTHLLIEAEAGSESIRWRQYIEKQLSGHIIIFQKPQSDKLFRAIPLANGIQSGLVKVRDTPHNREMMLTMTRFSQKKIPLVTDLVDSCSQGFSYLHSLFYEGMLGT